MCDKKYISVVLYLMFAFFYFAKGPNVAFFLSLLVSFLVLMMLVKSILCKNVGLVYFYIFVFLNTLPPITYFVEGMHINKINQLESPKLVYDATLVLYLFIITIYSFTHISVFRKLPKSVLSSQKSNIGYYISVVILILIISFAKKGEMILSSGSYSNTIQTIESNFIWEYAIVFIASAFFFSNNKYQIFFLFILSFIYCTKNILYGGRIQTLMVCALFLILYFQFKISIIKILIVFVVGYLFLTYIGDIREGVYINNIVYSEVPQYRTGNHYQVFYAGMRLVYMVDNEIISSSERIECFLYYLFSAIVPFRELPAITDLALYKNDEYSTGGGGLAPMFFYVYLSYLGTFFLGLFISKILNKFQNENTTLFMFIYALFVIVTTPRWFAYFPIQLIKMAIIAPLVYFIILKIAKPQIKLLKK